MRPSFTAIPRACLSAALAMVILFAIQPLSLRAQPSPEPPECTCSPGINIGTAADPVIIRHCQCGIMSCVVVVQSGQLQCTR